LHCQIPNPNPKLHPLSGTFFSGVTKVDDEIRFDNSFTVTIVLYGTNWATDISTDAAKRQILVNAVLFSNKIKTDPGYENAMQQAIYLP
jgi:hypothetical protein